MIKSAPDITFHYPPELFNLLVDTIPLLNRSKNDVLLFFQGAGVSEEMLRDLREILRTAPSEIKKFQIVRTVLEQLNARGEKTLRERREVLRRVVEFASFDSCWPNDQLKAKGLVAVIRDTVNQKDSFTRMKLEREQERNARLSETRRAASKKQEKISKIESVKNEFYGLFGTSITPQERGKKLETVLNDLFDAYGILVQEAFHLVGEQGEGIVEQIDGVIELKGNLYFVEMKWFQARVGRAEIAEHLVRLMSRAEGRGIFLSASDYTEPAVQIAREFLQQKILVLATLEEIVLLLNRQAELDDFLIKKVNAAQIYKNPYFRPLDA